MGSEDRKSSRLLAFHIGFSETGGAWLSDLFELNDYRGRRFLQGDIARDIFAAKLTGAPPLTHWARADLFADMELVPAFPNPVLEGYREFRFLDEQFPNALFILTERDIDEWIAAWLTRDDGRFRAREALRFGVDEAALPEIWRSRWEHHMAEVVDHFTGNPRFVRFDIDKDTPETLTKALAPWFDLDRLPDWGPADPPEMRAVQLSGAAERLSGPSLLTSPGGADHRLAERMAGFSLRRSRVTGGRLPKDQRSAVYGAWDGQKRVTGRDDAQLPMVRDGEGDAARIYLTGHRPKLIRIQGVLNDVLMTGGSVPLEIDMEDARWIGRSAGPAPRRPLICFNRREGVENMVLWPLPGYHTPGNPQYVAAARRDHIGFADKIDKVVWRGNLTGQSRPALLGKTGPDARPRAAAQIYDALDRAAGDDATREALVAELASIPRADFVLRFGDHPDFDVAITPGARHLGLRDIAPFSRFLGPSQPVGWFYRYRYVASIPGNDSGSNFLMAADSGSVVLREEDGWEQFYSVLFRPWEHYIPLLPGAADIEEKLAWARDNEAQCIAMSEAAQAVCRKLAGLDTRRAYLRLVLDGLTGMGGAGG